jgi:hypothetical protein
LSRATATRELTDLAAKGLLVQVGAGRSTRYELPMPGWESQGAARGATNKQAEAGSSDGNPVAAGI